MRLARDIYTSIETKIYHTTYEITIIYLLRDCFYHGNTLNVINEQLLGEKHYVEK